MTTIRRWVEEGLAPETIVAERIVNGRVTVILAISLLIARETPAQPGVAGCAVDQAANASRAFCGEAFHHE